MDPQEAIRILKNEPYSMGNHGEAVQCLRVNRVVVADTRMHWEDKPVWTVESIAFADDDDFQEMTLHRRAEEEFKSGLFWSPSPLEAFLHTVGTPGVKRTFRALVTPSNLLAVVLC